MQIAVNTVLFISVIAVANSGVAYSKELHKVEKNKALVLQVFSALESGDTELINSAFDPEGKSIIGSQERPRGGPFETFQEAAPFPAALDRRTVTVETLFAEDDFVAVQSLICGIHARELVGYAPTGLKLCARYTNLYTLKDGRITGNTVGFDPQLRKTLDKNRSPETKAGSLN